MFGKKKYVFDKEHPMGENDLKFLPITHKQQQTHDEWLFRFEAKINHDPGQFMQCSVLGIGESAISICSASEDFFELSIRSVGNVTHRLCDLEVGDNFGLRGPYGHGYEMDGFKDKDLAIVGGGSGVAPVRGVVQHIKDQRKDFGKVNLFFGFRDSSFLLFEPDFEAWKAANMDLRIAMDQKADYPGAVKGYVTDCMDDLVINDNLRVILCGPPVMIKSAAQYLLDKGIEKTQIFVSEERHMKCAVGRCGHCMIYGKYCCTDGPVFRFDEIYNSPQNGA